MAERGDVAADLEAIDKKFSGKWKLTKNENLDDYLKLIGLNFIMRKAAGAAGCTVEISIEGDKVRLITKGPRTSDDSFRLHETLDDKDPVGNELTATVTFEDGKLVTKSEPRNNSKAKKTTVTREIIPGADGKPDELLMTVTAETVVMKRTFVKQN
ncbi:fatty acid-binding protein homolog 5-like [Argopecten irradians]|uniref:fatty acid-binding protein homolog 5-like n=1 Tax=Argopecten irradians TaxID=31199 RepID=UPI00371CC70C